MNLKELANTIKKASEAMNDGEKFPIYSLAIKATKAAEKYPYDQPIVTASQVLTKMADSHTFISRKDLNSLYDKLYSTNTRLGDVFSSELNRNVLKAPSIYNRAGEDNSHVNDYDRVADPVLANALAAAFEGKGQVKIFSKKAAERAEKICNASLLEIGLAPKKINVFAGQEDIIICEASYETPKGYSNVLIPVEMKQEHALFPTMFLGQHGFVDLDADKLRGHIISTAGKAFKADANGILKVLSAAKNGPKKIVSDVEMAAINLRAEKGEKVFGDNIVGLNLYSVASEVKDPEFEKTAEHLEFSKRVTSPDGAARFLFSNQIVEAGRNSIIRKMADFGYKNVQVKVTDVKDSEIHYTIGIGVNAAILTPIKVSNGMVQPPSVAIASGKIKAFDKDGINELVHDTRPDTRMIAAASPSYELKPQELLDQVKDAVADGNMAKAEDAINVLGEVDKNYQRIAISILLSSLSGSDLDALEKTASEKPKDVPVMSTYQIFYPESE